jgi:hypothetical protein
LRRLAESLGRFPRAVRLGEIPAAVERVVRRRLQAGLGTGPGGALGDARIEQLRQCRLDR